MSATPISAVTLREAGYKEYSRPEHLTCARIFQKGYKDAGGIQYYLTFREWFVDLHPLFGDVFRYDADMSTKAAGGAHVWTAIQATTIEATERLARDLWVACGSVYYEVAQ